MADLSGNVWHAMGESRPFGQESHLCEEKTPMAYLQGLGKPLFEICCFHMGIARIVFALPPAPPPQTGPVEHFLRTQFVSSYLEIISNLKMGFRVMTLESLSLTFSEFISCSSNNPGNRSQFDQLKRGIHTSYTFPLKNLNKVSHNFLYKYTVLVWPLIHFWTSKVRVLVVQDSLSKEEFEIYAWQGSRVPDNDGEDVMKKSEGRLAQQLLGEGRLLHERPQALLGRLDHCSVHCHVSSSAK